MNLWPVEHFFPHFLTGHIANQSKSEEKKCPKYQIKIKGMPLTTHTPKCVGPAETYFVFWPNFSDIFEP